MKQDLRQRRRKRIRARVVGTTKRPRVAVFRSLRRTSLQVIDDALGRTLVAVSTGDLDESTRVGATKKEIAKAVGGLAAEKLKAQGVSLVVFDRGGYAYHGRVRAVAEGLRQGEIQF